MAIQAWLERLFETFEDRIKLNPDREERIEAAHRNLAAFVKNDGPISEVFLDLFPQGSWAIHTAIRPLKDDQEFDLDEVLLLEYSRLPVERRDPKRLIAWIAARLRTHRDYEGRVHERKRCVRIVNAGEFHVDVVPGRLTAAAFAPIEIPSKLSGWELTHPRGFIEWALTLDKQTAGRFSRVTKMLKHWRDITLGNESRPKSILLTSLVGVHFSLDYSSTPIALVGTMENLARYFSQCSRVPVVSNPVLPDENLARDWTQERFEIFRTSFAAATERARKALHLSESDKAQAIRLWSEIFGDRFPSLSDGDAKVIGAITGGRAAVGSAGTLVSDSSRLDVPIPKHRFYGGKDTSAGH